jgi:hypothetical protein
MRLEGLGCLGIRTHRFGETVALYRHVMGVCEIIGLHR